MKKNIMMRTASGLLIAVLLTTSIISGTLAKYTTSGSSTDTARVAKFGVEITANSGTGAFSKTYASDTSGFSGVTVAASENVVAPGTSGSLVGMSISGTPEVAVRVDYAIDTTATKFENWSVTGNTFYCPIVVTVGATNISGLNYTSSAEFVAAINNAVAAYSAQYPAGTVLSTINTSAPSISWAWAYEGGTGSAQTDALDTELGDNAASGTPATINIVMNVTVTQID